jgi:hypothetical protein
MGVEIDHKAQCNKIISEGLIFSQYSQPPVVQRHRRPVHRSDKRLARTLRLIAYARPNMPSPQATTTASRIG